MSKNNDSKSPLTRREALARLGLTAGAVYASPVLLKIKSASAGSRGSDGVSKAEGDPKPSRGKGDKGN